MRHSVRNRHTHSFTFRALTCLLCVLMTLSCFPVLGIFAAEGDPTAGETVDESQYELIYVSSMEDFLRVAARCVQDGWSKNKKISLMCDLNLKGQNFAPIPLFGGIFEGNEHTITGFDFHMEGSTVGLFRWILPEGQVRNLRVEGRVKPEGSAHAVGGLAGINEGRILNCTFNGTVIGTSAVGGIVGINRAGATVDHTTMRGDVNGMNQTGGIAGENAGTLSDCRNFADVNTTYRTSVGGVAPTSGEELLGVTDVGGVAGQNDGLIARCINDGPIGYQSVGYRVGGIVGRQTGRAEACANNGPVLGRRDVGGIVGKLVPKAEWNTPENRIQELRDQLAALDEAVDSLTSHIKGTQFQAGVDLMGLLLHLNKAQSALNSLSAEMENFVNGNIETVNELMDRMTLVLNGLAPVGEDLSAFSAELSVLFDHLSRALDEMKQGSEAASPAWDELQAILTDVSAMMQTLDKANEQIEKGLSHLENAVRDPAAIKTALTDVSEGFAALTAAMQSMADRLGQIEPSQPEGENPTLTQTVQALLETLRNLGTAMGGMSDDLSAAASALDRMAQGMNAAIEQIDMDEIQAGLRAFKQAIDHLSDLPASIESAATHLKQAIDSLKAAEPHMNAALDALSQAMASFSRAETALTGAIDHVTALITDLSDLPALGFHPLGSGFTAAREKLFNALEQVNEDLQSLSGHLTGNKIPDDLSASAKALNRLLDNILKLLDDFDSAHHDEPLLRDISAAVTDHEARKEGVIMGCINAGSIRGDTYVGGVVGSMEMEWKPDPNDLPSLSSLLLSTAEYTVYAAVVDCGSHATVKADKQAAGGIAGYMEYGLVDECKTSGEILSGGAYAGGIAGQSEATISRCRSRIALTGGSYVGGICGSGHHIYECLVLPSLPDYREYQGAVAGDADGSVVSNYYAGTTLGGVNGFSFGGQTESVSYEKLLEMDEDSVLFRFVTVTYVLTTGTLLRQEYPYGTTISELPFVPDDGNRFWQWDDFNHTVTFDITVHGRYHRHRTTISTDEKIPLFLVEGQFAEDAVLTVTPYTPVSLPSDLADRQQLAAHTITVADGPSVFKVRMKSAPDGTLYVLSETGTLEEQDFEEDGSYIVFTLRNGGSFLYTEKKASFIGWIIGGTGFFVLLLGLLVLFLVLHHRKKKKKKAKSAPAATTELTDPRAERGPVTDVTDPNAPTGPEPDPDPAPPEAPSADPDEPIILDPPADPDQPTDQDQSNS